MDLEIVNRQHLQWQPAELDVPVSSSSGRAHTVDLADVTIGCADTTTLVPAIVAGSTTYDMLWSTGAYARCRFSWNIHPVLGHRFRYLWDRGVTDSAWVNIRITRPSTFRSRRTPLPDARTPWTFKWSS